MTHEDEYDALARGLHESIAAGQTVALTAKALRILGDAEAAWRGRHAQPEDTRTTDPGGLTDIIEQAFPDTEDSQASYDAHKRLREAVWSAQHDTTCPEMVANVRHPWTDHLPWDEAEDERQAIAEADAIIDALRDARTAVAAPAADERDRLRKLLWKLLWRRMSHDWVQIDVGLSRCSKCGWGWKFFIDNNFPCPGFPIDTRFNAR